MNLIKKEYLFGLAMGLMFPLLAFAAEIPSELVQLAKELDCQTTTECAEKFDANIEQGIALAQKYDIYNAEEKKVAETYKTEVLERLRGVSQDNFEKEILVLANKILKEKPALARTIGVTRQAVDTAETIINTVKSAGVDVRTCQKSPEDLSRQQLIACVKAGGDLSNKEKSVGDYIPKGNAKAGEVKRMLELEDSLLAGQYSGLGKITAEQAGEICLKSGSESIPDCDRIAKKFFGDEGVEHLKEARKQTTRIKEYYSEGIDKMELVTPDGQKLIGRGVIKNACNMAFEKNNLGLARACGNFAVKNGYSTQGEIEDGLKLLENFSQKAGEVSFEDCRFNPESCREFLPAESRSNFDSQFEIFKIMSESIGFDPSRCENTYDSDIGKRCLEGAKASLSRIEEVAKNSPEARRIVNEIKSHITEGEKMTERRDKFNQDSSRGGISGPGGCKGPEECFNYCSQSTNSAECISFGAKSQIFDQNTAVQKFNMVNERFNTSPGQYPGFTDSNKGPDYISFPNKPEQTDPGFNRYPYSPREPSGPNPECLAAISSGDFVKAKTACSSSTDNYPRPIAEPFPVCPAYSTPSPCPDGQMRQAASDAKGCMAYGACIAIENYKPIETPKPCPSGTYWDGKSCVTSPEQNPKSTCPMMPTVSSCPVGQEKYETYNSPECGAYYACRDTVNKTPCTSGQYWNGTACVTNSSVSGTSTSSTTYSNNPATGCAQAGGTWNTSTSYCQMPVPSGGSSASCSSGQYWNGTACVTNSSVSGGSSSSMATMCAQGGGSWTGTTCQMPTTASGSYPTPTVSYPTPSTTYPTPSTTYPTPSSSYPTPSTTYLTPSTSYPTPSSPTPSYPTPAVSYPTPSYPTPAYSYPTPSYPTPSSPSAMVLCGQSGGTWTGAACNLAQNISSQKAYYNYFQKQSDPLLAQIFGAFADLFK